MHSINDSFEVIVYAADGETFLAKLAELPELPDIVLIDVSMEGLSGFEVAQEMSRKFPLVHKIALSTIDQEATIIRMLRAGCCAYLLKDTDQKDVEKALLAVYDQKYYNSEGLQMDYRKLERLAPAELGVQLNHRELEFLRLACSELTYKEIAHEMHVAERTVDGYRESLFDKLNVRSRVRMALEAISLGLVKL